MDGKNVMLAIVLSTVVLVVWATFFETPQIEQQVSEQQISKNEDSSSPSIEATETSKEITRNQALNSVERVKLENDNIKGSVSLEGGVIDDIVFKKYNKELGSEDRVIFLNPKKTQEGYYIETGWATNSETKLKLPVNNSIWKVNPMEVEISCNAN